MTQPQHLQIACLGLHKTGVETPQSPLATDRVFDNGENSAPQHGTVDISLESSSSSSCVNGHQQDTGNLLPGPPSSKIQALFVFRSTTTYIIKPSADER